MGIMAAGVRINTTQQMILYRDFIIDESTEGWEWTHSDYSDNGITGTCDTVFEAIEAVENWHAESHVLSSLPEPDRQRDEWQDALINATQHTSRAA